MKELELCKPSFTRKNNINVWQLYNKNNHRCNNRYATLDELNKANEAEAIDSKSFVLQAYHYIISQ